MRMASSGASTPTKPKVVGSSSVCTPSPLREGKDLWSITKRLESRGSEGKEALESMHDTTLTYMRACFSHAKRRLLEEPRPAAVAGSPSQPAAAGGTAPNSMVGDHCCNSPVAGKHIIGQLRAPPNTVAAGPASASSSSSSSLACGASKRQRRSVAEAAQVAQVRQKVALFESFKGATVAALPTSSAVGAGPSAAGVSNGGGGSPSSPARPVGEAPAAASGAAAGRGSGGSSSSGSVGSSTYHAVFPGLDLSLTSMPSRAALFAPPQPQPQQQPPPRASEEKVDAVVAPVEASRDDGAAAPGAPAQQIMAAMRELRIAETEGAMELVVHEEGPEPIIECNHKQPGAAPVWLSSSSKLSGEQPPPSSSQQQQQESGGFFGMVQKTLGLGKHRTSSTGGATQQQQQQPLPAPAAVSPPLSPLRPENTYQMSDSDEERDDDSDGFSSDDDDKDGRGRQKGRRAQKKVPAWARGQALAAALEAQFTADPQLWVDPDSIFPEPPTTCNLEEIFKVRKKRYYKRTSSGLWEQDGLTLSEKLAYKRDVSGKK